MPGRFSPPMPDKLSPQCASSALTSVPSGLPGAGCTTIFAGLLTTSKSASSYSTLSAMFCAFTVVSTGGGKVRATISSCLTRHDGSLWSYQPVAA